MSVADPEVEIPKEEPKPSGKLPRRRLWNWRDFLHTVHVWWIAPVWIKQSSPPLPMESKEKFHDMLQEQAQQARTMFFTYISAYAFLMVTLFSVTDKAILLNNTLIKLPIIGSDIPLNILFIVAPPLLIMTFNNFQIHYHRYVRTAFHPGIQDDERQVLFPFALFQGMFQHTQDGVGLIESAFAKGATFCLLTLALFCYLVYGGKFQNELLDYWLLFCLMLGVMFEYFWLQETFLRFSWNIGWIRGQIILKLLGIAVMMWGLWHLIPYTVYADPLRAFPKMDDLDWLLLGMALLLWQEGEKLVHLYGHALKRKKVLGGLASLLVVLSIGTLLIIDLKNWKHDQQKLDGDKQSQNFTALKTDWQNFQNEWKQLTKRKNDKKNKRGIVSTFKPMLRHVFNALHEKRFSKGIEAINGFLFLKLDNQALSSKPPGLDDIRDGLFPKNVKENQKDKTQKNEDTTLNWVPWLSLPDKSLNRIHLEQALLPWANLDNAHLMEAHLAEAELQYSHFRNAHLKDADLNSTHLEDADLSSANLENAVLSSANLKNADLSHANLENAVLSSTNLKNTNLISANLKNTNLSSANLEETVLDHANLGKADLSHANLENAVLSSTILKNAVLSSANLKNTNLSRANLENADLSPAGNLKNTILISTFLEKAVQSPGNLKNTILSSRFLKKFDLSSANLKNTNLENADLSWANLRGSYFRVKEWNEKTSEWIPEYGKGGEELCAAQTLGGAQVDYLLWKRLMKPTACPDKARTMDVYPKSLLKQYINTHARKKAKR